MILKVFKVCELKGLLSVIVGSGIFVLYDVLFNVYLFEDIKFSYLIEMGVILSDNDLYELFFF